MSLDKKQIFKYYSRLDIQEKILEISKDREVAFYFNGFFSKRPQVIEYLNDLKSQVNKGVLSFHISEERWTNPMLLKNSNSKEEVSKNRSGWDLIFDIDGCDFEISKIATMCILKYLEKIGVYNSSVKFSGNKGFHIGIPFESFSNKVLGQEERRVMFPNIPRQIAKLMVLKIDNPLSKLILKKYETIENISKKYNIDLNDFFNDNKTKLKDFWWDNIIEIDTVFLAHRHLFRAPYSINEKSGLVSIPINKNNILKFSKEEAKIENVSPEKYNDFEFLKYNKEYKKDGDKLIELVEKNHFELDDKSISFMEKNKNAENIFRKNKRTISIYENYNSETFEINEKIDYCDFPKTIKFLLEKKDIFDGRKRALFIILSFLFSINYSKESIENISKEWNSKLENPLKLNYLIPQINWFENLEKKISPPNFDNISYYKSIGIDEKIILEDINKFLPRKVKNPLHYIFILIDIKNKNKSKTKKKKN